MDTSEYLTIEDCKLLLRLLNTPGYEVVIQKSLGFSVEGTSYPLIESLQVQALWFKEGSFEEAFFGTDRIFILAAKHVRVDEVNVLYKGPSDWYRRWIGKWREIESPEIST